MKIELRRLLATILSVFNNKRLKYKFKKSFSLRYEIIVATIAKHLLCATFAFS